MTLGVIFVLIVMMMFVAVGVIRFDRIELTFTTQNREEMYNGISLTNHQWSMSSGQLKNGHTVTCTVTGVQKDVGSSQNTIEVVILDELGTDVTDDYQISYQLGTLKVTPRTLKIAIEGSNYTILSDCDGLVPGHRINKLTISNNMVSSIKIVDLYGEDVTQNYYILSGLGEDLEGDFGGSGGSGGAGRAISGGLGGIGGVTAASGQQGERQYQDQQQRNHFFHRRNVLSCFDVCIIL